MLGSLNVVLAPPHGSRPRIVRSDNDQKCDNLFLLKPPKNSVSPSSHLFATDASGLPVASVEQRDAPLDA